VPRLIDTYALTHAEWLACNPVVASSPDAVRLLTYCHDDTSLAMLVRYGDVTAINALFALDAQHPLGEIITKTVALLIEKFWRLSNTQRDRIAAILDGFTTLGPNFVTERIAPPTWSYEATYPSHQLWSLNTTFTGTNNFMTRLPDVADELFDALGYANTPQSTDAWMLFIHQLIYAPHSVPLATAVEIALALASPD
jgi:hypothetical protein